MDSPVVYYSQTLSEVLREIPILVHRKHFDELHQLFLSCEVEEVRRECIKHFGHVHENNIEWAENIMHIFQRVQSRNVLGGRYPDPLWRELLKWYVEQSVYEVRVRVLSYVTRIENNDDTVTKMLIGWFGHHPNDTKTYFEIPQIETFFRKVLCYTSGGKSQFGTTEKRILKLITSHKDTRFLKLIYLIAEEYKNGNVSEYGARLGTFERMFLGTKNKAMIAETIPAGHNARHFFIELIMIVGIV